MPLPRHALKRIHCRTRCPTARALTYTVPKRIKHQISDGVATTPSEDLVFSEPAKRQSPFYFETGYAIYAKRPSRPFPPPFLSLPSGSYSDPLTTHSRSRDRRPSVNGQFIRGITNGEDAIIVGGENFLGVNDGVGAWATRERGNAALWSRLIAHFWALEVEKACKSGNDVEGGQLDPVGYLQTAFEETKLVTSSPNEVFGTTTACSALLHYKSDSEPIIYATNLGDCAVLVIRPKDKEVIYRTTEQWHWFDCPRQLGTNSPDTPKANAVMDAVDIQEDDVVLTISDGVTDNLWEHEVCQVVTEAIEKWKSGAQDSQDGLVFVARELMNAARVIAEDPFAESPFMERAIDEGLAMEGGKMDDISVVLGLCRKRKS